MGERLVIFLFFGFSLLISLTTLSACDGSASIGEESSTTPTPTSQQQPDGAPRDELETLESELNTTNLAIEIDRNPDRVRPGDKITYELNITNHGPNPASDVRVVAELADSVSYLRDNAGCVRESHHDITCDLGEIPARESATLTLTVQVESDALSEEGDTTKIRNVVTVENLAGQDPDPDNNRAVDEAGIVSE